MPDLTFTSIPPQPTRPGWRVDKMPDGAKMFSLFGPTPETDVTYWFPQDQKCFTKAGCGWRHTPETIATMPEEVAVALEAMKITPNSPELLVRARQVVFEYLGGFIAEDKRD